MYVCVCVCDCCDYDGTHHTITTTTTTATTTTLTGMFVPEDFNDPQFENELEKDIAGGCSECGEIDKITVFSKHPSGVVAIKYYSASSASECVRVMNNRYFGGRRLKCMYWDQVTDYTLIEKSSSGIELKEQEEATRMEMFGKWLDDQQVEELPEELSLKKEE